MSINIRTTEADHTVKTTPSTITAVPPYIKFVTSLSSTNLPKSTLVTNCNDNAKEEEEEKEAENRN